MHANTMLPIFSPTAYKISTITATGTVSTPICLDVLFDNIELAADNEAPGIVYAEFGSKKTETIHKGYAKKLFIAHRKQDASKKRFDNQVTLVFRYDEPVAKKSVLVNSKVFKNGNVQMTGLKYIEQGKYVVDLIIATLQSIHKKNEHIVADINKLKNDDYRIRLINCDFRLGFEVMRDRLHKVVTHVHGLMCSFEPCIYPGCKIQYCYNISNDPKDGICRCVDRCHGKGEGEGDGNCKRITIAVFQSGCVIITGGQSMQQIDEAYHFACECVRDHLDVVYKRPLTLVV